MNRLDALSRHDEIARRFSPDAVTRDSFAGTQLSPIALESLVAWDVSTHAQREQARFGFTIAESKTARRGD